MDSDLMLNGAGNNKSTKNSGEREAVVEMHGVSKYFKVGESEVRALCEIDLTIESGEFIAIMGSSGSGKSTLLNLLGCLDRPTLGQYFLGQKNVAEMDDDVLSEIRGSRIGFIFQSYNLIPQLKVLENIQVPLIYQVGNLNEGVSRCEKLAQMVGLGGRLHHLPNQLSGGQQQRVAIARSLVNNPLVILADEPTGNLDSQTEVEILDIFSNLNKEGKTIIMVTHDDVVADYAHRVFHMKDGLIDRIVVNIAKLER